MSDKFNSSALKHCALYACYSLTSSGMISGCWWLMLEGLLLFFSACCFKIVIKSCFSLCQHKSSHLDSDKVTTKNVQQQLGEL